MLEPLGIAGLPQDISEGIGGLITLGNITDCQGYINRMEYHQRLGKEIIYLDCIDVSDLRGVYEIECSENKFRLVSHP